MRLPLLLIFISTICLSMSLALAVSLSKPNCPETCGNITIPYPFGVGSECSYNSSFSVICQNSTVPPKLFLSTTGLQVVHISLEDGTIEVVQPVTPVNCSNELTSNQTLGFGRALLGSPFTISGFYNTLAVLGCRNSVYLEAKGRTISGCEPICDNNYKVTSCNGINCCQTTIPPGLHELQYTYRSNGFENSSSLCGYVFIARDNWFPKDFRKYADLNNDSLNPFDQGFDQEDKGSRVRKTAFISIGSGVGALILVLRAWGSTKEIRKRLKAKRKHKFFKRNGGFIIETTVVFKSLCKIVK